MKPIYRIDNSGTIQTLDSNNTLQSFNGKPAIIEPNGNMYWCNAGRIYKHIHCVGDRTLITSPQTT